jgi:hypothetical protein
MISRIYADATGTTHLSEYELPFEQRDADGQLMMRGLLDVPTTVLGIHDLSGPAPSADFHCTSPRKLITVMRGTFAITASDGEQRRFGPGDCLLTDDLDSDGHAFADVGDEPLLTVIVELGDDWRPPGD